jgi:DNA-directed RNA polymerase subunit N (RpoN/RPB10)
MLYPICPTCGNLLANVQLPYQKDIKKLCEQYNVDIEMMSRGIIDNEKFNEEKKKILDKYTDLERYCCRMRLMNFCDIVRIVH